DPFRITLLDQRMPGMDGLELGSRIKTDPQLASTLMIMVASLGQRGDALALDRVGFAGYLTKPVRQSQLYNCISLVLARTNRTSEVFETSEVSRGLVTRHTVAECAKHGDRILLADDNAINQKVAQAMLNNLGYRADVVVNGREAVQALEFINYDLVLMDCEMPEMNGFEATAAIRNSHSKVLNHAVPIIAMTANSMTGDREECIEAGMDDYLAKPVRKNQLAEVLGKWLKAGDRKDTHQDQKPGNRKAIPGGKQVDPQGPLMLFDEAELLVNYDGYNDLAESVLDEALQKIPEKINVLKELAKGTDTHAFRLQAHRIKGLAAIICAPALREIADKIETAAINGDVESAQMLFPELELKALLTMEAIKVRCGVFDLKQQNGTAVNKQTTPPYINMGEKSTYDMRLQG
ncbi:MAG: response regulator, partial [Deltaproteobacteria bacterium]